MCWNLELIEDPSSDRFWEAMDLIAISFPPSEQMLPSWFRNMLRKQQAGEGKPQAFTWLALTDAESEGRAKLIGMALYQVIEGPHAYLWYLAVHPDRRSAGAGAHLYREVRRRAREAYPDLESLVFEIEIPDRVAEPKRRNAERRVAFYERVAEQPLIIAKELDYLQHVHRHADPVPMWLCLEPLRPLARERALEILRGAFELEN